MLTESTTNLTYEKLSKEEMEQRGILGRLVGVCASFIAPTRNGRKYPEQLWENIFNSDIMKERIANGVCFGELGHPADREETDMEKVCICMPEAPKKGPDGKLRAVFDILDTPNGRILKSLCDYGSTLGISSRGSGDLETDFTGQESVNPDTYNCEGFDIVLLPAVKEARLQYVTESLHMNEGAVTPKNKINLEAREFNYTMRYGTDTTDIHSAVVVIPDGLKAEDGTTMDASVQCEDLNGNVIDFTSVKEAQEWIDNYGDSCVYYIKNGTELHATPEEAYDESRALELESVDLNKKQHNKTLRQQLQESINNETDDNKKIMKESLASLGIKLDEGKYQEYDSSKASLTDHKWVGKYIYDNKNNIYQIFKVDEAGPQTYINCRDVDHPDLPTYTRFNADTDFEDGTIRWAKKLNEEKEKFIITQIEDGKYVLASGEPPVINMRKTIEADSPEEAKEILMKYGYSEDELLLEGFGKDYSDIPLVDKINYKNKKQNMLPGISYMPDFIAALEEVGEPIFKIRSSRFPASNADIKDDWMDIQKNGWSVRKDFDSSLSGFNEVYICKKLDESLTEDLEADEVEIKRDSKDTDFHRLAIAYDNSISFKDKEAASGRIADIIDYLENHVQPFDIYDNKTDNGCTIFYDGDLGIVESWGDLSEILNEANVADDDDMAIVNELQEALKLNKKLDEKIVSLQEKLSACYAKEMKLEETIDSYKIKAAELSNKNKENLALRKKISKLEEDLKISTEEAASKKTTLHETMQRDAKERKTLQESISNKDNEIARLTEELEGVLKDVKVRDKMLDENNEKLETLSKDNRQLKEKYSKKLEQNNKLIEKYKRIAKTAVDKYIDRQATILGVSNQEIKNRLPESYTFTDIDTICEGLREYKVNMNSLPFNTTLNENISLTAKNISNKTLIHDTDDEITDADIKLAERFIK